MTDIKYGGMMCPHGHVKAACAICAVPPKSPPMTDPKPATPATDEQVQAWIELGADGRLFIPAHVIDSLVARIAADAEIINAREAQVRRCHGIIQNLSCALDPDHEAQEDAMKELRGEFCPQDCTSECNRKAMEDAEIVKAKDERIAELEADLSAAWHRSNEWTNDRETIRTKDEEIERLKGTWRCFNCGFESADKAVAEAHFGDGDGEAAICVDWARLSADDRLHAYQDSIVELNGERAELATLREQGRTLREALVKLRDCDWVISLPDRMDAVRDIARDALAATEPKG